MIARVLPKPASVCCLRVAWFTGPVLLLFVYAQVSVFAGERDEYEMFNFTAGQVGIQDDLEGPQRYGMEYRFTSFAGPGGFRLIPAIGAAVSNNGANFIYSDLKHDFYINDQWLLIPGFGIGIFHNSREIDLGNDLEFRSGIELAYQFQNKVRTGVALFHLSNGGLSDHNPGTEALVFSVCIPLMDE